MSRSRYNLSPTLESGLDLRRNSFNALRLVFALFVLVGHGFHLGADRASPHIGSFLMPDVGVDGFFVISGYLITHSGLRSTCLSRYLWARVLRIFPAYIACLIVTAFVVTPVLLWQAGRPIGDVLHWDGGGWSYVLHNLLLVQTQHGIAGMPETSPVPGLLNGSLWTLLYEFIAYLTVAVLMIRAVLRRLPSLALWLGALAWLALLWASVSLDSLISLTGSQEVIPWGSRLALMFSLGMIARLYHRRIPLHGALALVSLVALLAASPLDQPRLLAAPFFAYLVLWLGAKRRLHTVGSRYDVSYGIYLYGWPVEQVLTGGGADKWPLALYILLATTVAAALALISCLAIELPALRLKRLGATTRPRRSGAPAAMGSHSVTVPSGGEQS